MGGLSIKRSLEEVQLAQDINTLGKRKAPSATDSPSKRRRSNSPESDQLIHSSLFLPPLEARTALRPEHIQDAFARKQQNWSRRRLAGVRNFRGGLVRTNVNLI